MKPLFKKIAIVGVGLIGGSLGLVCRQRGIAKSVLGWDRSRENLEEAVAAGAIDLAAANLPEAIREADLIVFATPVGTFEELAKEASAAARPDALFTDVGSVKGDLVASMEKILENRGYVPAHPIAGKERSGVASASAELFVGCKVILTPTERTDAKAKRRVGLLWERAGGVVIEMTPQEHDRVFAALSHLPHVVAYSLVYALLDPRLGIENRIRFSAGGLKDFTRIAASSPQMWRDICLKNGGEISRAIEVFEEVLARIKGAIARGDPALLTEIFSRAKEIRERL